MPDNLLRHETSPYLLQHADNPVHWRPWGPEALAEAERLNRPILLSIGYAACHWCHVMAHESFEDPATADLMNRLFVNIKVDREERPDVDQVYMAALHALGDQGGWPLTMFLTPRGEPIWGGTYFPKDGRYGRPAFSTVLNEIARLFHNEPAAIEKNRSALLNALQQDAAPEPGQLGPDFLDRASTKLLSLMDLQKGGVRGAPKFPQASLLRFLWKSHQRTGDQRYRDAVLVTLRKLCLGGIYDHLGGGFCRYSVDDRWLVPHFEKMLYDNGQLIERLAEAWIATGDELFRRRLDETFAWLTERMSTEGAFAASFDADTEGHEGATYVWSPAEVAGILGHDEGAHFCSAYDITEQGNFEGRAIPNLLIQPVTTNVEDAPFAPMRAKLLAARDQRPQPGRDDKILADWNAQAIAGLAIAGFLRQRPDWIATAADAYRFITESMLRAGRPGHSYREGRLVFPGFASDAAALARAALALHSATADAAYLRQATELTEVLARHYRDPKTGGHYLAADDGDPLVTRPRAYLDEATPSADSLAAESLVRLWHLTGEDAYREAVDRLLAHAAPRIAANVFGTAGLLSALDLRLTGVLVAIVRPGGTDDSSLVNTLRGHWRDSLILLRVENQIAGAPSHPAAGKRPVGGKPTAYVCREGACSLPVTEPEALAELIAPPRPG